MPTKYANLDYLIMGTKVHYSFNYIIGIVMKFVFYLAIEILQS